MTFKCGINFVDGIAAHTAPLSEGIFVVLLTAFARADAAVADRYAEDCPGRCKNKDGQVGYNVTFSQTGSRLTCKVQYILVITCSKKGLDRAEPSVADFDELLKISPARAKPIRRGPKGKRLG